jgi:hypothetical protein
VREEKEWDTPWRLREHICVWSEHKTLCTTVQGWPGLWSLLGPGHVRRPWTSPFPSLGKEGLEGRRAVSSMSPVLTAWVKMCHRACHCALVSCDRYFV